MRRAGLILLCCCFIGACSKPGPPAARVADINSLARDYLVLELAMGQHDPGHVDAYFGPAEIREEAEATGWTLDDIVSRSDTLTATLRDVDSAGDVQLRRRIDGLLARLQSLNTRVAINRGEKISFDEESRLLFGTAAPHNDLADFDAVIDEVDKLLPGDGTVAERVEAFLAEFTIPADRLSDVFDAAIAECRRRTMEYLELPEHEGFTVEYVNDKPWSGYNWYQGDATSLIQINTDEPSRIASAVRLGCHEGYPGHHVYNTLLEVNLVDTKGWIEFSLYPLFSPQSLIAEGSANYGVDLAFPGDDRVEFEKRVLFPLAGLDAGKADDYYRLLDLQTQLSFASNEIARSYLNGDIDRETAIERLVKYTFASESRAAQRTRFMDTYRSYVINYNHGKATVTDYVERDTASQGERWAKFTDMLSTSVLPQDLE